MVAKNRPFFFFRVILSFFLPRAHGISHPIRINSSVVCSTDSTIAIAPPKNQRFSLTEVSWALDTREDAMKQISYYVFSIAKGYSIERWRLGGKGRPIPGDTAGSWCQNRRFRQRKFEGTTVEGVFLRIIIVKGLKPRRRETSENVWFTPIAARLVGVPLFG